MDTYRIVAIAFFSLSLAIILLLLIKWCCTQCSSFQTPSPDQQIQYHSNQSTNLNLFGERQQFKQDKIQWTQINNQDAINLQEICSICLDINTNTLTKCRHNFHLQCLIQWKKRGKPKCPFCKAQHLDTIIFVCHECKKFKFQYTFQMPNAQRKKHMIPKMFLQYLKSDTLLKCQSCKLPKIKTHRKKIFTNSQQNKIQFSNQPQKIATQTFPQRIQGCLISSDRDLIIQME